MSLARSWFNDFDPIFRLIQEPQGSSGQQPGPLQRQAHVEVTEENDKYAIRAELPGVQKENLELNVGNDGKSLTIEGHVHITNKASPTGTESQAEGASSQKSGTYEYRSTFSRTIWFPHAVDGAKAQAKLTDGILNLEIPKRTESGRQKITLA